MIHDKWFKCTPQCKSITSFLLRINSDYDLFFSAKRRFEKIFNSVSPHTFHQLWSMISSTQIYRTQIFSRISPYFLPLPFCALQKLQQELEFLEVQEEYIKDEQKNLKKEFLHAQEEVKRIQSIPLVIGQFLEAVDQNTAIVGSTTGIIKINNCIYYVLAVLLLQIKHVEGAPFLHCWQSHRASPASHNVPNGTFFRMSFWIGTRGPHISKIVCLTERKARECFEMYLLYILKIA